MKTAATFLLAFGLAASAAGAASARPHAYAAPYSPYAGAYDDQDAYDYNPNEGLVPGVRQADGRACVRQCPNDMLPCDPPEFKRADGRCSGRID